jgi:putative FmdB family regulatory protein
MRLWVIVRPFTGERTVGTRKRVLDGMLQGMSPSDVRNELELSQTEYETAMRRLRRKTRCRGPRRSIPSPKQFGKPEQEKELEMPRYEFLCESCNKGFELIMTISEREKAKPTCPECKTRRSSRNLAASWGRPRRRVDCSEVRQARGGTRATLSKAGLVY